MAVRRDASRSPVALVRALLWGIGVGFLLMLLLLVGKTVLAIPVEAVSIGLVRLATTAARPWGALKEWSSSLFQSHRLHRELQESQKQLAEWQAKGLHFEQLAEENLRLRQLLGLAQSLKQPYLAAEVIAIGGSNWFHTVIVNKGEQDGVRQGAPVLNHQGLVGRIGEVNAHHSTVLLLTDRHSAVGVALSDHPNTYGIVKGVGKPWCELVFLSRHVVPRKGEKLVTSGLGGVFPKGIPVGEVLSVQTTTEPPKVRVRPFVKSTELREVIILTNLPPPVIP